MVFLSIWDHFSSLCVYFVCLWSYYCLVCGHFSISFLSFCSPSISYSSRFVSVCGCVSSECHGFVLCVVLRFCFFILPVCDRFVTVPCLFFVSQRRFSVCLWRFFNVFLDIYCLFVMSLCQLVVVHVFVVIL